MPRSPSSRGGSQASSPLKVRDSRSDGSRVTAQGTCSVQGSSSQRTTTEPRPKLVLDPTEEKSMAGHYEIERYGSNTLSIR